MVRREEFVYESFELGLEPIFWAKKEVAQQEGL